MAWVDYLIYGSITWMFVSVPVLILIGVIFGRLINLQIKYWLFSKRGFHKVEHMGIDKVVRTFFLRPKDDHFVFENGIYFQQKDALFKSGKDVMVKIDEKLLSKKVSESETAEEKELIKLLKQIGKLKYDSDSVFMQWGIPTIYYYGNDPNPLNPAERKKVYDSKVMFAYIKRLLLEKEWKLVQLVLILTIIGFFLTLILGGLYWGSINNSQKELLFCQTMLNQSQLTISNYLNATIQISQQSSTIII